MHSYTSLKINILQSHIHENANTIQAVNTGIKTDRTICKCLSLSFYLPFSVETRLQGLKKEKWKGEEIVFLTVKWAPLVVRVKQRCVFTSLIYSNIIARGKVFPINDSIWGLSRTMLSLSVLPADFLGKNWMSSSPVELKMKLSVPIIIKATWVLDTRGKEPKCASSFLFSAQLISRGLFEKKSFDSKKEIKKRRASLILIKDHFDLFCLL